MKNTSYLFRFSQLVKKYKQAREGVAAIEFVFVAPIMIGMYFGLAEISTAISADRKISHATNVAGDLATLVASITAADMAEIMTATTLVMDVPAGRLSSVQMELASFSRDADDNIIPLGVATLRDPESKAPAMPAFNVELNELILSESSGVVVARVSYEYEPLKLKYLNKPFTMTETFLLKPRKSATVNFDDGTGATTNFSCEFSGQKVTC